MQAKDAWRILAAAIVVGVLLVVGSLFVLDGRLAGGVAAGAVLGALNLYGLIRLGERLYAERPNPRQILARFLVKYGGMALIILVAFFVLEVSPVGFLLGLSNLLVAIALYSLGLLGHSKDASPPS